MSTLLRSFIFIVTCMSSLALAASATGGESKVWFAQGNAITVLNLGSEPVTVVVRTFGYASQGPSTQTSSKSLSLVPGEARSAPGSGSFALVVATRPVIVTASTDDYMTPTGSAGGQLFPRFTYSKSSVAYPIDCTDALPSHFACGQRPATNPNMQPSVDFKAPGTFKPTPNVE